MVSLHGEKPTEEQVTEKWFNQDIFAEAAEEDAFEKIESDKGVEATLEERSAFPEKSKEAPVSNELNGPGYRNSQLDDFEIVPEEASDASDSSSSSEESDIDDDEKAKILAYGKKMLRKKQREQILDDAYNRYMFDDTGLPKWFVEDEKKHCQPLTPVTKEEIAAMKAQFREIDARPAKKVAQAKARRKRAAMRQLDKARRKANAISDQTDISDRSKSRMIEQLYKKAAPKRPKKEFVVAKKGVQVKGGKGKVIVDRRMKKDARSRGIGRHGKGSSKKGKSVTGKTGKRVYKGKGSGNGNKGKKMKMNE